MSPSSAHEIQEHTVILNSIQVCVTYVHMYHIYCVHANVVYRVQYSQGASTLQFFEMTETSQ